MRVTFVLLLASLAAACGSDRTPTETGTHTAVDVYALASAFSPSFVQINAGDTVRFNISPAPDGDGHDVTFDAKAGAPANIKVTLNGVIARVFNSRGTFHYNCFVHPGMAGDVEVR